MKSTNNNANETYGIILSDFAGKGIILTDDHNRENYGILLSD